MATPLKTGNKSADKKVEKPKKNYSQAELDAMKAKKAARADVKISQFKRLAAKRTKTVLRSLTILGNCGNANSYTYTPEQLTKIFGLIDEGVETMKAQFAAKGAAQVQDITL